MAEAPEQVARLRASVAEAVSRYEAKVGVRLPDDAQSDVRLARFLDAFDGDVEQAKDAFLEMLQWRSDAKVDELREKEIKDIDVVRQASFPHAELVRSIGEFGPWLNAGESFEGDLIHLEVLAKVDPSVLLEKLSLERIMEHQIGFFEVRGKHLDDLSVERGKLVRTIQIRDVSNFGMGLLTNAKAIKFISAILKAGSRNYPESTKQAIFVDVPASFHTMWGLVSPALRKKTVNKVMFLQADFHRPLLELVPARAIHRLEKMRLLAQHDFVDNDQDDDHLPLEQADNLVVPARGKAYKAYWLTRTGMRQSVQVSVQPPAGTAKVPNYIATFASSKQNEDGSGGQVIEIPIQASSPQGVFKFPQDLPQACDSGFLFLEFDNSDAWFSSITVPLKATFAPVRS
eukprot:CAMPEP_0184521128 /NCGR_PEP_ID=MMETSP0198_2-20121128/7543_1 /TAXON_ID=1112570 /ORGANISM="Thraustochytrium sp., Strain LLF1b" /LENGTH=400 /DNA_ID=CAMNT_0026911787 /DNA_START=727 /DNA_END=1929 /DNA_ORIENTATION=+